MPFPLKFKQDSRKNKIVHYSSGDPTLDELLGGGGYQRELIYLLYGDTKRITRVLLSTSVMLQKSLALGGFGEEVNVAWIGVNNIYNPYFISRIAVSQKLSPRKVLKNILISRAFKLDQIIELLENRLSNLERVKVLLISGINFLFQSNGKCDFEDLSSIINKIKKLVSKTKPLLIISISLNELNNFNPKRRNWFTHSDIVKVLIKNEERFVEYHLIDHPNLPVKRLLKWKPREPKKRKYPLRDMKLDIWF